MKTIILFILGIIFLIIIPMLALLDVFKGFLQSWVGLPCILGLIFVVLSFKSIKTNSEIDEQTRKDLEKMGETEDYPRR